MADIEKQPSGAKIPGVVNDDFSSNPIVNADKLARRLSGRQVQMIAIGGTIGTGLFLGTGTSISKGGPASTLIAYAICGGIVFITMLCLGEMAAFIPVAGSFCTYAGLVFLLLLFDAIFTDWVLVALLMMRLVLP